MKCYKKMRVPDGAQNITATNYQNWIVLFLLLGALMSNHKIHSQELIYGNGYDLASPRGGMALAYKGSVDISDQEISPTSVIFNDDGTKIYVIGVTGKKVNQYGLNTAYDVTDGITLEHQYSTGRLLGGIRFNDDGTKMYLLEGRTFFQYTLNTAYDLSAGVTYVGSVQIFPAGESSLAGFAFNDDGSEFIVVGYKVHSYTLSTAYDFMSTVTFQDTYTASELSYITEVGFNATGTTMFLGSNSSGDWVYRYSLSAGFDISSTVTYQEGFDVGPHTWGLGGFVFSPSGNKMFTIGSNSDAVDQFDLSTTFEFNDEDPATLDGSYSAAVQVGSGQDVTFSDDGLIMHVLDQAKTAIYQYTLSTAFVVSTASSDANFAVGTYDSSPTDMAFSADGMTLFVVGTSDNSVDQFSVSSKFDISSTVIHQGTFDASGEQAGVRGIAFNDDGSRMFITGYDPTDGYSVSVDQYSLSTDYDITSTVTAQEQLGIYTDADQPTDIAFNDDGTIMLILDDGDVKVHQYELSTPYELDYLLSAPTYSGTWDVPDEVTPKGFTFAQSGTRMFIVGSTDNTVYQYTVDGLSNFVETSANDGSVEGSAKIQLIGDVFTNAKGTLVHKTHYSIEGLPKSLSPNLAVSDDGSFVTLNLTGMANSSEDVNDVDDLIFTFVDAAFKSLPASSIANSTGYSSEFGINFVNNNEPTLTEPIDDISRIGGFITAGMDVSATFEDEDDQTLTISASSNNTGVATVSVSNGILTYSEQGVGSTTITVTANDGEGGTVQDDFQLTITAAPKTVLYGEGFDVITTSNVTSEIVTNSNHASGTPYGMAFDKTGSKVFAIYNRWVYQFSMETPFDFNDPIVYDGVYNWSDEETSAQDVAFSADGSKMYVAGTDGNPDHIDQYALAVPFDITLGVTHDGQTTVGSSNPISITFNLDGSKMYVGNAYGGASVAQYSVSTPFDITAGITLDGAVSFSELTFIGSIDFNHDGSKMFMLDQTSDQVEEYQLASNFDIQSSITHLGSFSPIGTHNAPTGIAFNPNGSKFYAVGYGLDDFTQFNVGTTGGFTETSANDGSVAGSLLVSLNFETFTNAGSNLENGVDYTINNLPSGLVPELTVAYNGAYAILTLTGNAAAKEDADDITSLEFTFANSAFDGGNASGVAAAVTASSGYGIDFSDNNAPTVEFNIDDRTETLGFDYKVYDLDGMFADVDDQTLIVTATSDDEAVVTVTIDGYALTVTGVGVGTATITITANDQNGGSAQDTFDFTVASNTPALSFGRGYNVSGASYSTATSGLLSEFSFPYPYGVHFNPDGTRMFMVFAAYIAQFRLATPFDPSSASSEYEYLSIPEETDIKEIEFSHDGLKLYVTGTSGAPDYVEQYTLGAPFDITSGAIHDGSYYVPFNQPLTIAFNNDGSKYYTINAADEIKQYSLDTSFDLLDGSTLDGTYTFSSDITAYTMTFSDDGLIMILLDGVAEVVEAFSLSTPFDVLSTVESLGTIDISSINSATGIDFNYDGSKMFITGGVYDEVGVYTIDMEGGFTEAVANDGSLDGSLMINLTFDAFTNLGGALTYSTDYSIDNLPSGLVPSLEVLDPTHAQLTFTGAATSHANTDDLADLQFTFENSAFAGGSASAIANSTLASSGFGIDFVEGPHIDDQNFSVDENSAASTVVGTVSATDPEGGDVTFEIIAGNTSSAFAIDENSGQITVANATPLDFEATPSFALTVEVTAVPYSSEATITIDLNDAPEAPNNIHLDNATIEENSSINAVIGYLSTDDEDGGETYVYTLVAGDGDTDNGSFNISGTTLRASSGFDYETKETYSVRIQTNDQNGGLFSRPFAIMVTNANDAPTLVEIDNQSISESVSTGTTIGALTTTDQDVGDTFTYTMGDEIFFPDNASFDIVDDELVSGVVFDYESENSYLVSVISTDSEGATRSESFTISIIDVPASITDIGLTSSSVDEGLSSGALVGTLSTLGEEVTGTYGYDLITGNGTNDADNGSFTIVDEELRTTAEFDFETKSSFNIYVQTDDGQGDTFEKAITINVNDITEAPTDIDLDATSIAENNSIDDVIGIFTVTDEDTGEDYTYTLIDNVSYPDNTSFDIEAGELLAAESFDYETQNSFTINVQVSDGSLTYTEEFTITIIDNTNETLIWNGSSWMNGTPGAGSDDVIINGDYNTADNGTIDVNSITINSGFTFTVAADDHLYVVDDITNNGSLIIESGADLMSFETGSFTGNDVIIKRNTRYADGRYSFVGTPVQQTANVTNATLGSHVYSYDESQSYDPNDGLDRWVAMSGELVPGVGYTQALQQEITFEGVPNVGDVSVMGTYSGTYNDATNEETEGWVFVSNPYATAIDVADFLAPNTNIEGAVYIWDDNGSDNGRGTNSDYIIANGTVATNTTDAGGHTRYNSNLGSAQGFFVKLADDSDTEVSFTPDMRVTGSNSDDNFFRTVSTPAYVRVNLTNDAGLFKQAIVGRIGGISDESLDRSFDAKVFSSRSADLIYTIKAENALAIQGISYEREAVQLAFNVAEAGVYTLDLNSDNARGETFYLRDNLTEAVVNLTNESYSFSSSAGQFADRFELLSNARVLGLDENKVQVYAHEQTVYISMPEGEERTFQLLSLGGQQLLTQKLDGSAQIQTNLPPGIYIVTDGEQSHKVILK